MDNKIRQKRIIKSAGYILPILAGFLIGWLVFHTPSAHTRKEAENGNGEQKEIWTCSMHPQIRMDEPGKCPLCGMELIPLRNSVRSINSLAVSFSPEYAGLAGITTTKVSEQAAVKEIRLYGKVRFDERNIQSQVAFMPGRIDKLYVNYTGEPVSRNQPLALIYSPDLITGQHELLEAYQTRITQPEIFEAAKAKLRQWNITTDQIDEIILSGKVTERFKIVSSTSGIVTSKLINEGQYVAQGTELFRVADQSKMWILFDAYESDLPFLSRGEKISFTVQALPDKKFTGNIAFIDPVIDPVTRVAGIRLEVPNERGLLKPEMYVTGKVDAQLNEFKNHVVIPKSAILWTGRRSVVYLKISDNPQPEYMMREVELGPALGDRYVVKDGLSNGDEIVTNGAFSIDAAAQLQGKPSMMNPVSGTSGQISSAEFKVSGNCEMCKSRIDKTALSLPGIETADWDIRSGRMKIKFDKNTISQSDVESAIAKAGHDTEHFKAEDVTYEALPACCHYRK